MGWSRDATCVLTFRSRGRDQGHSQEECPQVLQTRQIGTMNGTCQYRHLPRRINDATTTTEGEECSGMRSVNKLNRRSTTAWAEMYASYEGLITYSQVS